MYPSNLPSQISGKAIIPINTDNGSEHLSTQRCEQSVWNKLFMWRKKKKEKRKDFPPSFVSNGIFVLGDTEVWQGLRIRSVNINFIYTWLQTSRGSQWDLPLLLSNMSNPCDRTLPPRKMDERGSWPLPAWGVTSLASLCLHNKGPLRSHWAALILTCTNRFRRLHRSLGSIPLTPLGSLSLAI